MDGKRKQFACVDAKAFYASVECVDRGLRSSHHQPGGGGRNPQRRHHLPGGVPLLESFGSAGEAPTL